MSARSRCGYCAPLIDAFSRSTNTEATLELSELDQPNACSGRATKDGGRGSHCAYIRPPRLHQLCALTKGVPSVDPKLALPIALDTIPLRCRPNPLRPPSCSASMTRQYGGSESYRHMCRFNSGFFYQQEVLKPYQWYWRVEPGVEVSFALVLRGPNPGQVELTVLAPDSTFATSTMTPSCLCVARLTPLAWFTRLRSLKSADLQMEANNKVYGFTIVLVSARETDVQHERRPDSQSDSVRILANGRNVVGSDARVCSPSPAIHRSR